MSEINDNVEAIFSCWNSKKEGGKWKVHREISYEIRSIIQKRLKQYGFDALKEAIDNYAFIVQSEDYKMSYLWTLYQFLSRRRPGRIAEGELQLYRFLPNSFSKFDFELTDKAKSRMQQQRKIVFEPKLQDTTDRLKVLREQADNGNIFAKLQIAKQNRPEVNKEEAEKELQRIKEKLDAGS